MDYNPKDRVEVYASAVEGLMTLEKDPEKQLKYIDFIDFYAKLTEEELERYRREYLSAIQLEEGLMGLRQMLLEEGEEKGMIMGLYDAIEVGLFIKFGDEGMRLMNKVREIKDVRRLQALKEAVKTIESLNDMRNRIES